MTNTIPASAPAHVCLVVSVSHPQDRAGTVCDPIDDRHWAQRNLQAVQAAVGAPVIVPLAVTNPFAVAREFELQIGPIDERHRLIVAREFQRQPSGIPARVRLLDAQGAPVSNEGTQTTSAVELAPLDQRQFQLLIELDTDVPAGQSSGVEARLIDRSNQDSVVGSLGVAVLGVGGP